MLSIRRFSVTIFFVLGSTQAIGQNVTTQAYDNTRSGAYLYETMLTPATVNSKTFGELYERTVDGDVQAQPLYVRGVTVPGQGAKNLVFVATAKNKLYAFDADNPSSDPQGGVVWSRQINSSRQLIVSPQSPGKAIEVCNETFNGFVGITGTPVIDPSTNTMFVVSWRPPMADLNLFTASAKGAVQFSGWLGANLGYHPWSAISPNSFVAPGQPITAVWSNPSHLDLFTVGTDGAVWSTWWEAAKSSQSWQWFRINQPGVATPGQTVTAVWSTPQHLDLFITAADGTVKSTWWEATPGWQSWFAIGPTANATPGQTVTAVWSTPQHLDLFITAADGTVKSTWWEATPGWQSWFAIGPTGGASSRQTVAALWPKPGHPEDVGGNYLHAIDIATGQEKGNSPVLIQASATASTAVTLDPRCHRNRPGLLLLNGTIYIAFSCLSCDAWCSSTQPFHGWVLGYRAADLVQVATFTTSVGQAAAGIWQSGSGLVGDAQGNIYFETSNGEPSNPATAPQLDDSFVKLTVINSPPGLQVAGSFQPANAQALRCGDTDLGSGGPLLLPGGKLIGGGKEGKFYLVDTVSMKADQQFQAFMNTWHADSTQPPCPGPHPPLPCTPPFPQDPPGSQATLSCYVNPARYQDYQPFGPNIHGAPVFWGGLIYKMPEKDFLKAFRYDPSNFTVSQTPSLTATIRPPDGMPGGFSSVSANGSQNGIVWTSFPEGDSTALSVPGRLVAFDALTLGELWEDDNPIAFSKFTPPTIADGRVYRATFANTLVVYGLIAKSSTAAAHSALATVEAAPGSAIAHPTSFCRTIAETYQKYGAEQGILGVPVGDEVNLQGQFPGAYRQYRGRIFGGHISAPSVTPNPSTEPETEDMTAFLSQSDVEASIYWSPATCGHVVMGTIRTFWLSLGAEKSRLGYPISDEIDTPDLRGRRSKFQHGEIWWYPDQGAFIHSTPDR